MEIVDIWDAVDRAGHIPGAWDCPCYPWVKTDMDLGASGIRTVRHVDMPDDN
jgi:hypothetical protein